MSAITPAASVLLSRGPGSREVFAILRGQHLKFFGGFWAFPGGKLSKHEAECDTNLQGSRIAACRELFEETGILIARRPDGTLPRIDDALRRGREKLLKEEISIERFIGEQHLTIDAHDFVPIGKITTPAFAPVRFGTMFFVAHLPPEQSPEMWPGELERGEWIDSRELVKRWNRGDALVTPPSVMSLQALGDRPIDDAPTVLAPLLEHLNSGALHPIFFAPCVQMIPLKSVALPPSAYTNAWLVGNGPRYLIDPGADDAAEQLRLFDVLDDSPPLAAVVLSHHHPDHVGAALACAQRYRLPIWAHPRTADKLRGRIPIDRTLDDGDKLDLGPCPADGKAWHLEALYTPGHASGHLAFLDSHYGLLFAGDMVSTMTSVVISPPDGDLTDYLNSLQRLRSLPTRLLLPSHGNVSAQPVQVIDGAIEHRAKREAQLLEALADGPANLEDVTQRLYRGTPEALMRFARAQVLAGLIKLQYEGRALPLDAERWQLA